MTAPYVAGSETSKAAALSIEPRSGTDRWLLLQYLRYVFRAEGATDDEMQARLNLNPSTQRPRRIELCEAGLVRNSGQTRKTRSGRQAVVWIATEAE